MAVDQTGIFCLLFAVPLLSSVGAGFHTCASYKDDRGQHHEFKDCGSFDYCCGTCTNRYCCGDLFRAMSSLEQNNCNMSGGLVVFIVFGVVVALIFIIVIICALCPGCQLYKMRMRRTHRNTGAVIHTYPGNQPAPYHGPQPVAPYPGPPPPQATPYPGPQPMGPSYPPTAGYNPALTSSALYGAPGQPPAMYPPPGPVLYGQAQAPPQPLPMPYPPS